MNVDSQYALFYKFIHFYENELKQFNTDKAAKSAIRTYNDEYIRMFGSFSYQKVKKSEAPIAIDEKNCVYMTNSKTKVLSFLFHLRNALCHASWKFMGNDKYFYFYDKRNAMGCVKTEFVFDILNKLLNKR